MQVILPNDATKYQKNIVEILKKLHPNCKSIKFDCPGLNNSQLHFPTVRRVIYVFYDGYYYIVQLQPPAISKNKSLAIQDEFTVYGRKYNLVQVQRSCVRRGKPLLKK